MKKRISYCVIIFIVTALYFTGCVSMQKSVCPYSIEKPRMVLGASPSNHQFAGVYFTLCNESEKTIESCTVSFLVYDEEGENPFTSSNCVIERVEIEEEPYEVRMVIVNLDGYLTVIPDDAYKIDSIYLQKIQYTDGSSWTDPFGMYALKERF